MDDKATPDTNGTNTAQAATTTPPQATPVLAALKATLAAKDKALADATTARDTTIADLTAKLNDAVANGASLQGKITAQAQTIDTLHEALAEYEAIQTFLGLPVVA